MKSKFSVLWLSIIMIIVVLGAIFATYAYVVASAKVTGTFDIDVSSKGVDVFELQSKNASIEAKSSNFGMQGSDLVESAILTAKLSTTNASAEYCYNVELTIKNDLVFINNPSVSFIPVLLTIYRSSDGRTYNVVRNEENIYDVTEHSEYLTVGGTDVYKIKTTKNVDVYDYWKAEMILKYVPGVLQEENNNSKYSATLNLNRIEC